jgi:hypothetical protein
MVFITTLLFAAAFSLWAQSGACAVIIKMKGAVTWQEQGSGNWQNAAQGQLLNSGTLIKTGDDGLAMVKFLKDKSMMRMKPKTVLSIKEPAGDENKEIGVSVGGVLFNIQKNDKQGKFQVQTPTSVATVQGTKFWVIVEQDGKTVVVGIEDMVELLNLVSGNRQNVGPGQTGFSDSSGVTVRATRPEDLPSDDSTQQIEIKFKDNKGSEKSLHIELEKLD